jgi:hypothetical protein
MIDSCQRRSRRSAVRRTSMGTGWHLRELVGGMAVCR